MANAHASAAALAIQPLHAECGRDEDLIVCIWKPARCKLQQEAQGL